MMEIVNKVAGDFTDANGGVQKIKKKKKIINSYPDFCMIILIKNISCTTVFIITLFGISSLN